MFRKGEAATIVQSDSSVCRVGQTGHIVSPARHLDGSPGYVLLTEEGRWVCREDQLRRPGQAYENPHDLFLREEAAEEDIAGLLARLTGAAPKETGSTTFQKLKAGDTVTTLAGTGLYVATGDDPRWPAGHLVRVPKEPCRDGTWGIQTLTSRRGTPVFAVAFLNDLTPFRELEPTEVTFRKHDNKGSEKWCRVKLSGFVARLMNTDLDVPTTTDWAVRDQIVDRLKTYPIDYNGHFKNGQVHWADRLDGYLREGLRSHTIPQVLPPSFMQALQFGTTPNEWVSVGHISMSLGCPYCGDHSDLESNGLALRIQNPCTRPEGIDFTEVELNVPSGKLVIANDLRDLFRANGSNESSGDGVLWQHGWMKLYEEVGMAHGFVGNTCPGVYRLEDGSLKIANGPSDETWDSEARDWVPTDPAILAAFGGEHVGGICTDLCWYSIVDLDEYVRRGGDPTDEHLDIVDVEPGVYLVRHSNEAARDAETVEFATITRVRDPDPVKDYSNERECQNLTAEQTLWQHAAQWPTLYCGGKPWESLGLAGRAKALAGAAGQILCTGGSGTEWHENGFPIGSYTSTESVEIPLFTFRRSWYPWFRTNLMRVAADIVDREGDFEKSMLGLLEGRDGFRGLNPSYVRLALNVCMSVISYGMTPRYEHGVLYTDQVRDQMLDAINIYRGLRRLNPDVSLDPDFDAWMDAEGRAERWVKTFDLDLSGLPGRAPPSPVVTEAIKLQEQGSVYAEFDASKLTEGSFSNGKTWANQATATGFALPTMSDTGFWSSNAGNTVPLQFTAKVVGEVLASNIGYMLEIDMGDGIRRAFKNDDQKALRLFINQAEAEAPNQEVS